MKITILGQPLSKNKLKDIRVIKSGKRSFAAAYISHTARNYIKSVQSQCIGVTPLEGPVRLTATLYYTTQRPDLEESVLIDALQGFAYLNDRQVREKHIYHGIDKENPRAEIEVEPL